MKLMPAPLSQLHVKGTCPSVPQQRGALGQHGEGMCPPCSRTLTRPIPHAAAVPTVNGSSSHGSKPPHKGCLFPTAPATDTLTPLRDCRPMWPGCSPRHGWGGRAEESRRWGGRHVKSWEGALGFCSQNTLATLQHHPRPSPPSRLQLGLSALLPSVPGGLAAPGGDFVTDTSGWGGEGQGVRHEGVGQRSVRHREGPHDGAGWGSPIYVPAEEVVLHKHVLHPFLQWLLLLLLPLYWQLPVLREAEGKFAENSQLTFDLHPARTAQE